jgi:hypothetical protein
VAQPSPPPTTIGPSKRTAQQTFYRGSTAGVPKTATTTTTSDRSKPSEDCYRNNNNKPKDQLIPAQPQPTANRSAIDRKSNSAQTTYRGSRQSLSPHHARTSTRDKSNSLHRKKSTLRIPQSSHRPWEQGDHCPLCGTSHRHQRRLGRLYWIGLSVRVILASPRRHYLQQKAISQANATSCTHCGRPLYA